MVQEFMSHTAVRLADPGRQVLLVDSSEASRVEDAAACLPGVPFIPRYRQCRHRRPTAGPNPRDHPRSHEVLRPTRPVFALLTKPLKTVMPCAGSGPIRAPASGRSQGPVRGNLRTYVSHPD